MFAVLALVVMSGTIYNTNAQSIECGQTITQSVTLDSDLNCVNSGTDGIVIGANGIILDCAGHTISGPVSSYRGMTGLDGITLVHANGVTVKNCHVAYFDNGFVVRSISTDNKLVYDKADNNGNYGFDIMTNSNNNQLYHDEAAHNGGYGFVMEAGSNGNQVDSSLSSGNTEAGFVALTGSNDTAFENDKSYKNLQDGFIISSSSSGTIQNSQAVENAYSGFALFGSSGASIGNNTSTSNGMGGYLLVVSSSNKLDNNNAEKNGQDGFLADSDSIGNVISNNTSTENTGIGYEDSTQGSSAPGTANTYDSNLCQDNRAGLSSPTGLCN